MIPRPSWRAPFDRGLAHLYAGRGDAALRAFDEVRELSGNRIRPLRRRVDFLRELQTLYVSDAERVRATRQALSIGRASKDDVVKFLYAFFSELSFDIQHWLLLPDVPVNLIVNGNSAIVHVEAVLALVKSKQCYIGYLPPEILLMIGRFALGATTASIVAVTLASVSRRWRNIFEGDSRLWSSVVLDGPTETAAIAKANFYIARKHAIRQLEIRRRFLKPLDRLLDSLRGRLPDLETLVARSLPLDKLWTLFDQSPKLANLTIYVPESASDPPLVPRPPIEPVSSVRSIALRCGARPGDSEPDPWSISWLPGYFPNLEELILDMPTCDLHHEDLGPLTISHIQLRRLTVSNCTLTYATPPQTRFVLPNLRRLDLSGSAEVSYVLYLFPFGHPPNTAHLTHLILHDSDFDAATLVGHLPLLASLVHLDARSDESPLEIVQALGHPGLKERGPRLCPRLEELVIRDWATFPVSLRSVVQQVVRSRTEVDLRITIWAARNDRAA